MSLVCGGRGPCCHIGYAHRHCEHCDVVIPTYHYQYPVPYYAQPTYYGTFGIYNGLSNLANQLQLVEVDHTHQEAT